MENTQIDYLEYNFLTGQLAGLMDSNRSIKIELLANPNDVELLANQKKLAYDMMHVTACIQKVGVKLIEGLENKYAFKSKFMLPDSYRKKGKKS